MPQHVWKPQLLSVLAVSDCVKLVVVEGPPAPHQNIFKVAKSEVIPMSKYMRKWVVKVEGEEVVIVSASNRCQYRRLREALGIE